MLVEMADMREANRSYEANLQVMKQAREMITMTIDLMRELVMIDQVASAASPVASKLSYRSGRRRRRCRRVQVAPAEVAAVNGFRVRAGASRAQRDRHPEGRRGGGDRRRSRARLPCSRWSRP